VKRVSDELYSHSRESGNPEFAGTVKVLSKPYVHWIPAFAGMTKLAEFMSSEVEARQLSLLLKVLLLKGFDFAQPDNLHKY